MKLAKQPTSWNGAHVRLKQLYDARVAAGTTQKAFGLEYGIGSQSMVAQYLNGIRPLNYEAAAKFAKGLRCTIYDISPEMAESLQIEILPFLGKALRRAAMYAAIAVLPALTPSPADASTCFDSDLRATVYYVKWWLTKLLTKSVRFLTFLQRTGGAEKLTCS